jgi:hypothetical protein
MVPPARLIHAQFFEQRLALHITTFAERRSELELLIASYTAGRVHDTAEMVSRVEFKVDSLLAFLNRLESPREKEAVRFIESNGGIANCVNDDRLLEKLLTKTGEHTEDMSDEGRKKLEAQLVKELTESDEELLSGLKKNMANFEGMLRVQNNNIQHMSHVMENSTSQIMKISNEIIMMFPGMKKHGLLRDPVSVSTIISLGFPMKLTCNPDAAENVAGNGSSYDDLDIRPGHSSDYRVCDRASKRRNSFSPSRTITFE